MNEKSFEKLQSDLNVSMMFLKAAEEAKQLEAERTERNLKKAAAAAEKRRKQAELEKVYREYRKDNPPTPKEQEMAKRDFLNTYKEITGIDLEEHRKVRKSNV